MTSANYNLKFILSFVLILLFGRKVIAQNHQDSNIEIIDSLLSKNEFKQADSILKLQIDDLKQQKSYSKLTQYIYYTGKISLKLENKKTAIAKVRQLENYITTNTDTLYTQRKKHLSLSKFYVLLRDYKTASKENIKALRITEKIPDATSDLLGIIHHNLSIDYRRLGNIKKAIEHSKKALNLYLAYPKSDTSKVLEAYNSLGSRMWDVYKLDSALFYFKQAEKLIPKMEPTPMNKFYHTAKMQANISSVYSLLGEWENSLDYSKKAILNYSNFIKNNHNTLDFYKEEAQLFLFITIENLADDYQKQGYLAKARDLLDYVYNQKLKKTPNNKAEIAYTCLQLGNINLRLKNYDKAKFFLNKGLSLYNTDPENNSLGIADAYFYQGVINESLADTTNAKFYFEKSDAHYKTIFEHNYDAFYLSAILKYSNFYAKNGYSEKALQLADKAYNYVTKNQGKETLMQYDHLLNLAQIHYYNNNYETAKSCVHQALKVLGTISASYNEIKQNTVYLSFKKPKALLLQSKIALESEKNQDIAFLEFHFQNLKKGLSILEEQKSLVLNVEDTSVILDENDELFEYAKHFAMLLFKETKQTQYLSEILLLHESKLYTQIRKQLRLKSNFEIGNVPDDILKKEKKLEHDLNTSLNSGDINTFLETEKKWNTFITKLKETQNHYYKLKYEPISDCFKSHLSNLPKHKTVIRYVFIIDQLYAFVINNETPKLVELNNADLNKINLKKHTEQNIFNTNFETNFELYKTLWQPLEKNITSKHVTVIPDGKLFNISFETLTQKQSKHYKELVKHSLINQYIFSYNYSLLLIDKNKQPRFFENNYVAFTPEFNETMKTNYKVGITDSTFIDKTYLTLIPQPFTVNLAKEYSRLFNGEFFTNENASKQIFKNQAAEHKIIHIGTHAESNNISPEFSRLIFAKNSDEDNYLYTYEIYNQNLSSNLAILTACETGKPTFQPGEGMISLAHAFNYAGSESILTSLWKIDEQASAKILKHFYDYLNDGLPKDEALQKAKLKYLKNTDGRTLAPQYWAGLVLIGDTSSIQISTSSSWWIWLLVSSVAICILIFYYKKKIATT